MFGGNETSKEVSLLLNMILVNSKFIFRIWQCSDGHAICEFCRKKPHVTCCPVCRKYIVGRSNIAEKVARCVFSVKEDDAIPGTETDSKKKFTLTGYKEIST